MLLGLIPFDAPKGLSEREDARWRLEKAVTLGLDVIQIPLRSRDENYALYYRDIADEHGIELETGMGSDFVTRAPLSAEELAPFIATIRLAQLMGLRLLRIAGAYTTCGRFFPPAVDVQMANYAVNLRELTPHAEEAGVLLAIENHCEFRGC